MMAAQAVEELENQLAALLKKLEICGDENGGVKDFNVAELKTALKEKKQDIAASKQSEADIIQDPGTPTSSLKEDERLVDDLLNAFERDGDDKITVSDFLLLASDVASGKLPKPELKISKEKLEQYQQASVYEKITKYPRESLEQVRYQVLSSVSKNGMIWVKSLVPTNQITMLLYVFVYAHLTKDLLLFLIPLVTFYIAFFAIVIVSMDMFCDFEVADGIRDMTSFLRLMDSKSRKRRVQYGFLWHSFQPYIVFAVSAVLIAFVSPMCDKQWMTYSLFFVVASFFTVPLADQLDININLGSVIQGAMMSILLFFAIKSSLLNQKLAFVRAVTPALMCITWGQITFDLFPDTTWKGILQVAFGWGVAIVALPLGILYLILQITAVAIEEFLSLTLPVKVIVFIGLLVSVGVLVLIISQAYCIQLTRSSIGLLICAILLLISAGCFVSTPSRGSLFGVHLPVTEYCDVHNMADAVARDSQKMQYMGRSVQWRGTIADPKVLVENSVLTAVSSLPYWFQQVVRCTLGKEGTNEGDDCDVTTYNKYTFSADLNLQCSSLQVASIKLNGGQHMATANIKGHTMIWINGTVLPGGNTIRVTSFRISGKQIEETHEKSVLQILQGSLLECIKFTFGPLVTVYK